MADKRIVILTGAGISAESGIATFRASDGLWEIHRVDDVATPEGFARNPKLVHVFYNARRARLQQALPGRVTLVTQNVDDLHERAGSTEVLHMHGSLLALRCLYCDSVAHDWHGDCSQQTVCPSCKRAGG
ncbi:MAG: Sir2 family NAD-dependent protein deacetylase, partial [Cardiobacterium sp.]